MAAALANAEGLLSDLLARLNHPEAAMLSERSESGRGVGVGSVSAQDKRTAVSFDRCDTA